MSTRSTVILSLILIAAALALSLAAYGHLPAAMASHWNANDQVNGSISRFWGAFLVPLLGLVMLGLFMIIPAIDPLKANIAKFRGFFNLFILVIMVFLLYLHVLTISWNLGMHGFRMSAALLPAVGLLLVLAGLMMRRAKRNFFIGIRTPWTLSSDHVWDKTHRIGGALFVASGILAMLAALFPGPVAYWLVLFPVLASSAFAVVYSYVLWRRER
jgi:immunity protein, SdpI family